ncbi:uncharacterized protein LOC126815533 [Patella vulgata]|uniref:uncharacterized protein LOC126815533 n=1 Tax=Patella vulgata TaxID=6465 RepID=UPI00217FE2B0|nr:uncharacterized protein LOC126815533 [Patella vulgata]
MLLTLVLITLQVSGTSGIALIPDYVWPLGNDTARFEVINGHDAIMPESGNCYEYAEGHPELPYRSLRLNGKPETYVDILLDGTVIFKDLTISFYLYPEGVPTGTLVHYLYDTGNILRVSIMESILFISFWDEYGVSVGATALPEVILPDQWNHLIVSREFSTGTVTIYHNGALMEQLDDDFPNNIQLPISGHLRLGRSHDKTDDGFLGRLTCFQLFDVIPTASGVADISKYCQPELWTIKPDLVYEEKIVDGVTKQCLANLTDGKEPTCLEIISQRCLTNGVYWQELIRQNEWNESNRDVAYFRSISKGFKPSDIDGHLLANVKTVNGKLCSRLCMKIDGCQSYITNKISSYVTKCLLYDAVRDANQAYEGAKYFVIRS